jgi:hypothetical protein
MAALELGPLGMYAFSIPGGDRCSPDEVEGKGEVAGQRGVAFFGRGRGDGQTAEGVVR